LIDRTRQVQAEVAGNDRQLAIELDALIRALEQECRELHASYMRRRSSLLKLCELLAPATHRRTRAVA
jgi:hypothetical protein